MKKKNKIILTVIGVAGSLGAGYLLLMVMAAADLGYSIPPENHTSTTMYPLKTRILKYVKTHNALPSSLSVLPPLEGYINSTKDAWGNEIIYKVEGTTVKLISYGKDAKPGGVGDNLDVIGVFEAKNSFGEWADETSNWKVAPLTKVHE